MALAAPSAPAPLKSGGAAASVLTPKQVQPLSAVLIALALLAILVESGLLLRSANRWRMGHV
jgi:hypothetical protein